MWRTLTCLGLLAAASAVYAQTPGQERREERRADRQDARAAVRGRIVRVDSTAGTVVVATGTAPNVQEVEYRFDTGAKFYGPDQAAITGGLKYEGFKPGADIWFTPAENAKVIREVRFYDPSHANTVMRGKIVRADPDRGIVVIRTGTGPDAREVEYHVDKTTRYWGPDQAVINDALRYQGFKEGTDIWYQPLPNNANTIGELRFYDPAARRPIRRP
ncbi:MAG: hypothetical protein ACJ8F7_01940 [Gemmataceae bacterium]